MQNYCFYQQSRKGNKLRFGFKQHTATDDNGLVVGIVTTSANESDIVHLDDVLEKVPLEPRATVKADKGYKSTNNDNAIKERGFKNY